ncbi:hypothetical protein ATCC90586_009623 [Pythium insidiosum]|nr:hypothetical protein ATCC90586_009623 [Pythium insidiosum]
MWLPHAMLKLKFNSGNTMDKRVQEASAPVVKEPYECCTSNALRRECYRRKLRVVKSGPYMNATKQGYIQLLRANDAPTSVLTSDGSIASRWEQLHARLQVVDHKLLELYTSLEALKMTHSDERRVLLLADVAFYERLKEALKSNLLEAVNVV